MPRLCYRTLEMQNLAPYRIVSLSQKVVRRFIRTLFTNRITRTLLPVRRELIPLSQISKRKRLVPTPQFQDIHLRCVRGCIMGCSFPFSFRTARRPRLVV